MYKRKLTTVRVRKHRAKKRCLETFENENKRKAEHMIEDQSETSSSDMSNKSEEEQNKMLMEHNVYSSNIEFGQHSVKLFDIDMDSNTSGQNNNDESNENWIDYNIVEEIDNKYSQADSDNNKELDEISELRKWAIDCNICAAHLDKLLYILRQRLIPQLPNSSKVFLGTRTAEYKIERLGNGEFVYFGIKKGIQNINVELHNEEIYLILNVDGMPLFRSSLKQLWTILAKIDYSPDIYKPFPVAIYCGDQKPGIIQLFLKDFINEINSLHSGVEINGKRFKVLIKCFTCDTPARSYLKQCKGHTAYFSCERCIVQGERFERRIIFTSGNYDKRTDRSFRMQEQPEHHIGVSPLLDINPPINMIHQFVLDYMHLCCIGIMKKLLEFWLENSAYKLSYRQKQILIERSVKMSDQIPCEYQRKTRSLVKYFAKLKATELRFILLYSGPLLFKKLLKPKLYKHFLLFHTACRLLSNDEYALKYSGKVKIYLHKFVKLSQKYYGKKSQSMNMHNLTHLVDDVTNLKCNISKISCFPFESALGKIKQLVRSGNHVLAQICRRLQEKYLISREIPNILPVIQIIKEKRFDNIFNITSLKYKEFTIKNTYPDNVLLLENGICIMVELLSRSINSLNIMIKGKELKKEKAMYIYPFKSDRMNVWRIKNEDTTKEINVSIEHVKCKLVALYIQDQTNEDKTICIIPLLHT